MCCSTDQGVGCVWQSVENVITDKGNGRIEDDRLKCVIDHLTVNTTWK